MPARTAGEGRCPVPLVLFRGHEKCQTSSSRRRRPSLDPRSFLYLFLHQFDALSHHPSLSVLGSRIPAASTRPLPSRAPRRPSRVPIAAAPTPLQPQQPAPPIATPTATPTTSRRARQPRAPPSASLIALAHVRAAGLRLQRGAPRIRTPPALEFEPAAAARPAQGVGDLRRRVRRVAREGDPPRPRRRDGPPQPRVGTRRRCRALLVVVARAAQEAESARAIAG